MSGATTAVVIASVAFLVFINSIVNARPPQPRQRPKIPEYCTIVPLRTPERRIGSCCLYPGRLRHKFENGVTVPDVRTENVRDQPPRKPKEPTCDVHDLIAEREHIGTCCTFVGSKFFQLQGPLHPFIEDKPSTRPEVEREPFNKPVHSFAASTPGAPHLDSPGEQQGAKNESGKPPGVLLTTPGVPSRFGGGHNVSIAADADVIAEEVTCSEAQAVTVTTPVTEKEEVTTPAARTKYPEIGTRFFIDTSCKDGYVLDANYECVPEFK